MMSGEGFTTESFTITQRGYVWLRGFVGFFSVFQGVELVNPNDC